MTSKRARIFVMLAIAFGGLPTQSSAASGAAAEVLAFEKEMEAAVVRGDVKFLDRICASDFSFTHGDGWTTGGAPLRVENRAQWLASVSKKPYLSRELDQVQVELHGDIAITYGMYRARYSAPADPTRADFTVWFERVYARRNGQWQYVSHRTVHGPTYGPAGTH
ncbi:MAG TPA: nuclear transport factor 2 family protein [Bryobacteraceae bacterium]|nr:nuclear transport factor 2 family protein [Bryobacteraceae bacterium]